MLRFRFVEIANAKAAGVGIPLTPSVLQTETETNDPPLLNQTQQERHQQIDGVAKTVPPKELRKEDMKMFDQ